MHGHPDYSSKRIAMKRLALLPLALLFATPASAFDSGSTGVDGTFAPQVDTTLALPADGIFNFAHIDIPSGVTVRFTRNAANTPVTLLVSGNAIIAGTIDLDGEWGAPVGTSGDGALGDDGTPGKGAPGGYDGGSGGAVNPLQLAPGGTGLGPGGGGGGVVYLENGVYKPTGAAGASYGTDGEAYWYAVGKGLVASQGYGSPELLPLIGGSGGGGGGGGNLLAGAGGGGGGGAILIAVSGTTNLSGAIYARGGKGGDSAGVDVGAAGGGGSGGAIRIATTRLEGNGILNASGGNAGTTPDWLHTAGRGGDGRIRLEAEEFTRTAVSTPSFSFSSAPDPAFLADLPALRFTSVAGVAAPAQPTGSADITLPADTVNPVTVELAATGIPLGNTIEVTVVPATGAPNSAISSPLAGTIDNATASVNVELSPGPSTLMAETTYTIVAALGDTLAPLAGGERVERVRLAAALNGPGSVTLITVSGKEYTHPAGKVPLMPAG